MTTISYGLISARRELEVRRCDLCATMIDRLQMDSLIRLRLDATPVWTAPPLVTIGATESPEDVQLRRVSGAFFMERCANLHRL